MKATIRKQYVGHNSEVAFGHASWNYIINGKGDWGNWEPWNKEEEELAGKLATYIEDEFGDEVEIIFEGDVVSVFYQYDWDYDEFKVNVDDCFKTWKKEVLPTL